MSNAAYGPYGAASEPTNGGYGGFPADQSFPGYGGRGAGLPAGGGFAGCGGGGGGFGAQNDLVGLPSSGNSGSGQTRHSLLRTGPLRAGLPGGPVVNHVEMACVPWVCLVLILSCFLLAGSIEHNTFFVLWLLPLLLLVLCGAFTYNRHKNGKNEEVLLGTLCATAILAALVVGAYAHFTTLQEYWRLGQGASYFNVLPSELAAGKSDAASLVFTNASRVDTTHTYGFVDGNSKLGTLYCIAPISSGDAVSETRVQYWAVGLDCCFPRSDFHCGQSTNMDAHGALVLTREERNQPQWDLAINGAQKAYSLQAGDDVLLVKWIADPMGYRNRLWRSSVNLFMIFGAVYLLISFMVALAVMPSCL